MIFIGEVAFFLFDQKPNIFYNAPYSWPFLILRTLSDALTFQLWNVRELETIRYAYG